MKDHADKLEFNYYLLICVAIFFNKFNFCFHHCAIVIFYAHSVLCKCSENIHYAEYTLCCNKLLFIMCNLRQCTINQLISQSKT